MSDREVNTLESPERLARLRSIGLLDTPAEPRFDRLTRLVSKFLNAPIALVSLVEDRRQFFKSALGLPEPWATLRETPSSHSLCKQVVRTGNPLVLEDARVAAEFCTNFAVTELGVIAYLGVPLTDCKGFTLGSLCAIDREPRAWSRDDLRTMNDLAETVMAEINLLSEITDRRAVEARLQESEVRLRGILESTMDGLVATDREGRIVEFNRSAEMIFGHRRVDVIGRRLSETIIPPESRDAHDRRLRDYFLSGQGLNLRRRIQAEAIRADGSRFPVELAITMANVEGTELFMASVNDITERKRADARILDREARLRSIFEGAVDGIIVLDAQGRIESFNPAAERLFGYRSAEIVGQGISLLLPDDERINLDDSFAGVFCTRDGPVVGTSRHLTGRRKDGRLFAMELSVSPVEIGDSTRHTWIVRDITDRRRGERNLRASNALLAAIQIAHERFVGDSGPAVVFLGMLDSLLELTGSTVGFIGEVIEDGEGHRSIEPVAVRRLSSSGGHPARPDTAIARDEVPRELRETVRRVLETAQVVMTVDETREPKVGAPPRAASASLGLPVLVAGRLVGVMALARRRGPYKDRLIGYLKPLLTSCANLIEAYRIERRREQAEAELVASKEAAEAANRAKSDFLANMSHEVRTPMAAILGYADFLLEPGLSPELRDQAIQTIRRNGAHLLQIINDILDLSKIEAGKLTIEPVPCSPLHIVNEVASALRVSADERRITLEIQQATPLPAIVRLDPIRVRQILMNLVSNAIKFSEPDGRVAVRLRADRHGSGELHDLIVEVEDRGIGITPEQQKRLFIPFQQADNSTTRRFGGTGLGLSITRRLLDAMNGRIQVRSDAGLGSCFIISIPIEIPGDGPWIDCSNKDEPRDRAPRSGWGGIPQFRGRILLAEDNTDIQRMVVHHLERLGLDVDVAENGRLAVDRAMASHYDLILMDLQMPVLDGYGATSSLRKAGYTGPIVALTAHAMREDRERSLRAGCDSHLIKPIDPQALAVILCRFLAGVRPGDLPTSGTADARCPLPPDAMLSSLSDDPSLSPLIRDYIRGLPGRHGQIREAIDARDLTRVATLAHQVRGVGGMYGFPQLSELAGLIEDATGDAQDLDLIAELIDDLGEMIDRIRSSYSSLTSMSLSQDESHEIELRRPTNLLNSPRTPVLDNATVRADRQTLFDACPATLTYRTPADPEYGSERDVENSQQARKWHLF